MEHSESLLAAQDLVQTNSALRELLELLPPNTAILVRLEQRIETSLVLEDGQAKLVASAPKNPEWDLNLEAEGLRRLLHSTPDSVLVWTEQLFSLWSQGHLTLRPRMDLATWWARGYPQIVLKLSPQIQREISKVAFQGLLVANSVADKIKSVFAKRNQ